MPPAVKPAVVQPGMGRDLRAFGDVLSVMLGGAETNQTEPAVDPDHSVGL